MFKNYSYVQQAKHRVRTEMRARSIKTKFEEKRFPRLGQYQLFQQLGTGGFS
jgi:hypothetical protein